MTRGIRKAGRLQAGIRPGLAWALLRARRVQAEGTCGAGAGAEPPPTPLSVYPLLAVPLCLSAGWIGGWLGRQWLERGRADRPSFSLLQRLARVDEGERGSSGGLAPSAIRRDAPSSVPGVVCEPERGLGHLAARSGVGAGHLPARSGVGARPPGAAAHMARARRSPVTIEATRQRDGAGALDSSDDDDMPSLLRSASPSPPPRRPVIRSSRAVSMVLPPTQPTRRRWRRLGLLATRRGLTQESARRAAQKGEWERQMADPRNDLRARLTLELAVKLLRLRRRRLDAECLLDHGSPIPMVDFDVAYVGVPQDGARVPGEVGVGGIDDTPPLVRVRVLFRDARGRRSTCHPAELDPLRRHLGMELVCAGLLQEDGQWRVPWPDYSTRIRLVPELRGGLCWYDEDSGEATWDWSGGSPYPERTHGVPAVALEPEKVCAYRTLGACRDSTCATLTRTSRG